MDNRRELPDADRRPNGGDFPSAPQASADADNTGEGTEPLPQVMDRMLGNRGRFAARR
jgi:hypothetical protein